MNKLDALYPGNDQCITLPEAKTKKGVHITDGTCSFTVEQDGVEVGGQTWPINMPFVVGTDSEYEGVMPDDISGIVVGERYDLIITFTSTSGNKRHKENLPARDRPLGAC